MYDIELSNIYSQINYKIVKYLLGKFTRLGIGKRKYWGTLQLNNYIHGIHGIFLTTSKSYSSTLNIYMENRPLLNQNKSKYTILFASTNTCLNCSPNFSSSQTFNFQPNPSGDP